MLECSSLFRWSFHGATRDVSKRHKLWHVPNLFCYIADQSCSSLSWNSLNQHWHTLVSRSWEQKSISLTRGISDFYQRALALTAWTFLFYEYRKKFHQSTRPLFSCPVCLSFDICRWGIFPVDYNPTSLITFQKELIWRKRSSFGKWLFFFVRLAFDIDSWDSIITSV